MPRLLFEKTGNAVWISHLDLMRLFQRAFKRAGLNLQHTQGYNPRPSVSIALPMSVGVESRCELLDFDLEGETVSFDEIKERLNQTLVSGVKVLEVYENQRAIRHIALLDSVVTLEYDRGVPADAAQRIGELFSSETLLVEKRGKNGVKDQDLIPMIRSLRVVEAGEGVLELHTRASCQNPTLNPMQLHHAVCRYLPELVPDYAWCRREEIYDAEEQIFR